MGALKDLLGSAYKEGMTEAEIDTALGAGKYVNLKDGRYVDKDKYDRLEQEHNTLKANSKDVEALRTENETLKAEKADRDLSDKLLGYGFKKEALKYVKGDIADKSLVIGDKDDDNKKAVAEYLKTHPQFGTAEVKQPRSVTKIGTRVNEPEKESETDAQKTVNGNINAAIRNAAKGNKTVI